MSDQASPEPGKEATPGQPAPRSSMLIRITVLVFLVAVVGAECLVASLLIPSSPDAAAATAAPGEGHEAKAEPVEKEKKHGKESKETKEGGHGKEAEKSGHGKEAEKGGHGKEAGKEKKGGHGKETPAAEEPEPDAANQVEVDLEQFSVTAHQPTSNTTMRIEFHLFGVVSANDKAEFERLVKSSQHRLRDQILVIVRGADARDLADAGLGLIKRQVLEKINTLLGKPLLRAVIVSDFSYIEQ